MTALVEAFAAGQEQLADPIERIGLAAPVVECLLLDAPANRVDATVPDAHHMKRVRHAGGVGQVRVQAGPVRLGQICRHHTDPVQPCPVLAGAPSPHVSSAVALDHVDEDAGVQVDQPGGVQRGVGPVGSQPRRLVNTQLGDRADPVGIIDQRGCRARSRPP
jgi:hypothetical protein